MVAQAGDAEDFLRKALAHRPDVAVVDVRMPPKRTDDGLRAALELRAQHPDIGVLVLSQYYEESYALELIGDRAEGVGYLLKERVGDVEAFTEAVGRVAAGGSALDPEVVARMLGRRASDDPLERSARASATSSPRWRRADRTTGSRGAVRDRGRGREARTSIFHKLGLAPEPTEHRRVLAALTYLRNV